MYKTERNGQRDKLLWNDQPDHIMMITPLTSLHSYSVDVLSVLL